MTGARRMFECASAALVLGSLAGCTGTALHVPMPEAGSYDPGRHHVISQRSCGFMLAGAIPIAMGSRYQRGYDALMAQAPGEYVTDIKVREMLRYAFVGWRFCAFFEATAYARGVPTGDGSTALDRLEKLHQEGRISDSEYEDLRKRALERLTAP